MARKLQLKTNVVAPSATYPFGRIKDDTGSNNGTPVDEAVYGDFHQFFEKLLLDGAVTANNLPENATNGFQYNQALGKFIRTISATISEKGTAMLASLAEMVSLSSLSPQDKIVTPYTLFLTDKIAHTETRLTTKVIEIGNWNMVSTSSVSVAHGLDIQLIRSVSIMIINDLSAILTPLDSIATGTGTVAGMYEINASNINLNRQSSGFYNNISYDSTPFNRGWITITYEG